MGFFTLSKKTEDNGTVISTSDMASVGRTLRSKFKIHKGKEREPSTASFVPQSTSAAETLAIPTPIAAKHLQLKAATVASSSSRSLHASTSSPGLQTRNQHDRSNPPTPSKSKYPLYPSPSNMSPTLSLPTRGSTSTSARPSSIISTTARQPTDSVTMTLAQRLNELAVANSEGLLNDDEYRLLRQDLFQRFASSTVVPTETPVVPARRTNGVGIVSDGSRNSIASSRPSSNFVVDKSRTPSVHSKSSVTSGMASLFRRGSGRRTASGSNDYSDTSSIFSASSAAPSMFNIPRFLTKKSSSSSVGTEASRLAADAISISSRRTGGGSEHMPGFSSSISRSNTSIRRLATPPSSFPGRAVGHENKYGGSITNVFDEENLKTVQQIRQEMVAVEAEGKRLIDAFNSLELNTLTKRQRRTMLMVSDPAADDGKHESTVTLIPHRRANGADSDGISIKSGVSIGTSQSISGRSMSNRRAFRQKSGTALSQATSSRPGSLRRKNSVSSVASSSQGKSTGGHTSGLVPPLPALPPAISVSHLNFGSTSSLNLTRSTGHLPMSAVPEDEIKPPVEISEDEREFEHEMEDIRRRREEVGGRYEARLEYLRAKLKGAQLHEKLLNK